LQVCVPVAFNTLTKASEWLGSVGFLLVMGLIDLPTYPLTSFGGIIYPASTHQHYPLCCLSRFARYRYAMTDSLLSQLGKMQPACCFNCTGFKNHRCSVQTHPSQTH